MFWLRDAGYWITLACSGFPFAALDGTVGGILFFKEDFQVIPSSTQRGITHTVRCLDGRVTLLYQYLHWLEKPFPCSMVKSHFLIK